MKISFPKNIGSFYLLFFITVLLCIGLMIGTSSVVMIFVAILIFVLMLASLETGLYILLISSLFFHPLDVYKLPIKASNIRFLDILLAMFLVAWVIRLFSKKDSIPSESPIKFLYIIIGFLSVFLIIGVIRRHNPITILRDARSIVYYSIAFATACIIQNKRQLKKIVVVLLVLSVISLFYYYLMRILDKPFESGLSHVTLTSIRYTRSYGFYSTWAFFALYFFILANFIFLNKLKLLHSFVLWGLALAFLAGLLLTLLRTYFLGLLFGVCLFAVFLWFEERQTFIVKLLTFILIVTIISICLSYIPQNRLMHYPMVERYLSIFIPSVSTRAAMVTRQDRFEAILYFTRGEENSILIGKGFGDIIREEYRKHLLWHSSLGWAFYRLGIIPTIIFYSIMGLFLLRTIIHSKNIVNTELKSIYYGFMCFFVFLLAISATSGVLFDKVYEMTLVGFTLGVFLALDNIVNNMQEEDKVDTKNVGTRHAMSVKGEKTK